MMNENLCIYHGGCPDGFASAFVLHDFFKRHESETDVVEFYHMLHEKGKEAPYDLAKGKTVYLLDCSYKKEELRKLASVAKTVIILDHHVSAFKDLVGDPSEYLERSIGPNKYTIEGMDNVDYFYAHENYSGVGVTWNYFYGRSEMPLLLQCVQDRDIWQWKIPGSKYILKGLDTYPYNFNVWESLLDQTNELMNIGKSISRYDDKLMTGILQNDVEIVETKWGDIPVVNCPKHLSSEIGNKLSMDKPFSLMYYKTKGKIKCSLRSNDRGEDVSVIATELGGGGHKRAAGFEVNNDIGLSNIFKYFR